MKKNQQIAFVIICLAVLVISSCSKDDTKVRVQNQFFGTLYDVSVGPASFGSVGSEETTSYNGISEGSHTVKYKWSNGTPIEKKISISNEGKYTVIIDGISASVVKD